MEEDKFRGFSDFFNENDKNKDERADNSENEQTEQTADAAAHFAYGPFQSSQMKESGNEQNNDAYAQNSGSKPTNLLPVYSVGVSDKPRNWDYPKPRRKNRFTSGFSAFLAGVLVMGGLMFASDKLNLFGGDGHSLADSPAHAVQQANADDSNHAGVKNAALEITRPGNIAEIAKKASPAVVKIETYVKPKRQRGGNSFFNDPFFDQFFGDNFFGPFDNGGGDNGGQSDQLQPAGMGSGFIFEQSGYILTNEHVIDGADEIKVTVEGYDNPFTAKLLGTSYDLDLAVLKISGGNDFATLSLGDDKALNVGDWVIAIGNPYGFDHTVTVGVLSAKERPITIPDNNGTREYKHLLQTDASINPGNSGGPLLDLSGNVIGINTAVSAQAQGIGFAIPTSTITDVLNKLKNNENVNVPKPYIGVSISDIESDWVDSLKLKNSDGSFIRGIVSGSPADKAGLKPYDVITEVDGEKIKNSDELVKKIGAHKVGDRITLTIVRNGKEMVIGIEIGDENARN
ncbi:MAG TPA: trypsin-like peptidase domain-containing protein [Bacilli bacterium]